ncbi:uncharacterized protein LOC110978057 [Acanthaster planci]|uniref:Uncharacterized protein LOC110978057 n=1 Tax=Acanthaster planci TaxID=133434 RepID=A0A8B7Y9M7_ACAPL|nr:uncharacterized protein LOC110978057 [Acanthaster planci]
MASQKRILVWCTPRSLSTVLMRSLSQFHDSQIIFEYLLLAGINIAPPGTFGDREADVARLKSEPDFDIHSWKEMYERPYPSKAFIIGKEFAELLHGRMEMIPDGYTHVFLIRHPSKVFASIMKSFSYFPPDVRQNAFLKPNYFRASAAVYDFVTTTLGQQAPVIHADDLQANPAKTLQLLCEATGLPFSQDLLRWGQVKEDPPSNWLISDFTWELSKTVGSHNTSFGSTCFYANKETSGAARETPVVSPDIQLLMEDAMPYYESLYERRLIIK